MDGNPVTCSDLQRTMERRVAPCSACFPKLHLNEDEDEDGDLELWAEPWDSDEEERTEGRSSAPHSPIPNFNSVNPVSPPLTHVSLQHTSTSMDINSKLQQKRALEIKKIPQKLEKILPQLKDLCLCCLVMGTRDGSHHTHQCKHWVKHKQGGTEAFAFKKAHFCNQGDTGYCYTCLLNPDAPLHGVKVPGQPCLYAGIVFEIVWLTVSDTEMMNSIADYLKDSRLKEEKYYAPWLKKGYDGMDKKWRNCATQLVLWFHDTYLK
ncbi:uncharacterized protein EI90DRAFT_3020925 [Cantharellus anzutake]|uniref:uncharacterized protein n=1 Tax=Cantharellus anzutake TaxID=1750568 RepID=UPI001906B1EE|nr:uncharacterized protein EI90DRAFT_3020925 [Cantharellus anzutake]KAF8318869.1 hypothetical protein EI90DRAFT_3020925 [Cantharellus anzutake]